MFLKINNLISNNGKCDYKELDLNLITPGTQIYPATENTAYFEYSGEIIQNTDVAEITEQEYLSKKQETEINRPKTEMELALERIEILEMDNAQLIKDSAKKDITIEMLQSDVADLVKVVAGGNL